MFVVVPAIAGLLRLRFDSEVLDLLPQTEPVVQGLKIYQQNFSNSRELIITLRSPDPEKNENAARTIASDLRTRTNLVASVLWQPPWMEHPDQAAEMLAAIWFNQPPEVFGELTNRLASTNLSAIVQQAKEQLSTSMSPMDIARRSFDPYDLMNVPTGGGAPGGFGEGQSMFGSEDGTFRIVFVRSAVSVDNYRQCIEWLGQIRSAVTATLAQNGAEQMIVKFTGRPAFLAEISSGMQKDMSESVVGTVVIIAVLFWLAHRRIKPMLWLVALLVLILVGTFGLGGLVFGSINVVSMGFAAILLGLAVDYAVVHYQEALAHPNLTIPEIRRAIAPSISWAAVTTISAFLVLNLGGLPGLGQLGSLVAIGVALAALVMVFVYLPPLFPERRAPRPSTESTPHLEGHARPPGKSFLTWGGTICLLAIPATLVLRGFPAFDPTADALRPSRSEAYTALDELKVILGGKEEPLWVLTAGKDEQQVWEKLQAMDITLRGAKEKELIADYLLPTVLWPAPRNQAANKPTAAAIVSRRSELITAPLTNGFSSNAVLVTDRILTAWESASRGTAVFWPTNEMSQWVMDRLVSRSSERLIAVGLVHPNPKQPLSASVQEWAGQLPKAETWVSGWALLGPAVANKVIGNMWQVLIPMGLLVLGSLWFAFKRFQEIALSLLVLVLSALALLTVMRWTGWKWNLLNLMALPLILGTGVDYSIFVQLALRRYGGDAHLAHRSVGRALILCGATAAAGFGSLGWSNNQGISSLGQLCAIGIGLNMLISVYLLPGWWWGVARPRR